MRGGHAVYTIKKYSNLTFLLRDRWHMGGINDCLDSCYVDLQTVRYYLYQHKDLEDFNQCGKKLISGSSILVFTFVRMDGVRSKYDDIAKLD